MAKGTMLAVALFSVCDAQPSDALPFDPRHHFDTRCPAGIQLDPEDLQRDPASTSTYLSLPLPEGSSVDDCARACCGDWSCNAFVFSDPKLRTDALTGDWYDHNSVRGVFKMQLWQIGRNISAHSLDSSDAHWKTARGELGVSGLDGWFQFPPNTKNNDTIAVNRSFIMGADGLTLLLSRESSDPEGFSQFFTRARESFGGCADDELCCSFKDDIDATVPGVSGVRTGVRSKLPAVPPPYPKSTAITGARVDPKLYIGINGDEFPITWGADGHQYTGAGDNQQAGQEESPLSFFKVVGGPTEMGCDHPETHEDKPSPTCKNVTQQGGSVPIQGEAIDKLCPQWRTGVPNLKSSGLLSVSGVLYWAVSCFNYGDDMVFNRQRYGPAWIVISHDNGVTWNLTATPLDMFPGRLAAPRFVQYGQDYAGAPDDWVYVYFPGTTNGDAFFENNDQMLLGRVDKRRILERGAYQFFNGVQLDGVDSWTSDATIAVPVWSFPLMTSVQQVNYHAGSGRYVFGNWAWVSYDGYPRPDHTPDDRNARTGHQRSQLLLVEAPRPWGPFSIFYRDDDWAGSDGSTGGYTPVIPPAWSGANDFWIVSTQCCGNWRLPLNNYNFNAQHVTFSVSPASVPSLFV